MSFSSDPSSLINQLPISLDLPPTYPEAHEILSLLLKRITDAVNKKEGSLYTFQELGNFQVYATSGDSTTFRNVYRFVYDLVALNGGPIAGGATVAFPNNITGLKYGTLIYATCTTATSTFTVTYPNATVDVGGANNINFTNPLPATPIINAFMVCEYLKN